MGSVRVSRAYYHCRHCGRGQFPRDGQLGLSACDLSRGAAQALALTGTLASFAEAATKAALDWIFEPGMMGAESVAVKVTIPFRFIIPSLLAQR